MKQLMQTKHDDKKKPRYPNRQGLLSWLYISSRIFENVNASFFSAKNYLQGSHDKN